MIINQFTFAPFLIDNQTFRRGIYLYLAANNGRDTNVEVSPLPGYSKETLENVQNQLLQIKRPIQTTWWSKPTIAILSQMHLYPSVHFAIETAIYDLLDPILEEKPTPIYSLLTGTPSEILSYADELEAKGQKHIKIKLGHLTPLEAYPLVDALKERFSIRIDFNRKWKSDDTIAFCNSFSDEQFVYVEEPCQNPNELIHFPHPFAIDESLRDQKSPSVFAAKNLKALIIKPTLHYPFQNFLKLSIPCVVTSSFESSVGIRQIYRLIQRFGLDKMHHGLDTLSYLRPIP